METIECLGEGGYFPEGEFRHDQNGKLIYPYIHERGMPHYITGVLVVGPGGVPVLAETEDEPSEIV